MQELCAMLAHLTLKFQLDRWCASSDLPTNLSVSCLRYVMLCCGRKQNSTYNYIFYFSSLYSYFRFVQVTSFVCAHALIAK